jgi:hypothetical protein
MKYDESKRNELTDKLCALLDEYPHEIQSVALVAAWNRVSHTSKFMAWAKRRQSGEEDAGNDQILQQLPTSQRN